MSTRQQLMRASARFRRQNLSEGVDQVYLPGEIEWRKREMWVDSGIPLHVDHLRDLASLAEELEVDICWEW